MIIRIINYRNVPGASPLHQPVCFINTGTDRKAMHLHLQPDWQRALGQYVEVRRRGEIVRTGTVEDVMPDNSILWISAAGPFPREMLERAEGYEVYARYPWDPAPIRGGLPKSNSTKTPNGLPPASAIQDV
jgi:hypothetical protein